MKSVIITVDLPAETALPLAQFLKRVSFETCRHHSDPTLDEEPYRMLEGLEAVRTALADAGYAPR